MNCRNIVVICIAIVMLFSLAAQAHRDNSPSTNFVKMPGVTCVDNGNNGASYIGANAISNLDRTADPQDTYAGAFHSNNRASSSNLVTLTITFPSSVTINHVAWNTATFDWDASTTWSIYADGNKIVENKVTASGGPGTLLAQPYGAIPSGGQHEVAYFAPVTCTEVVIKFKPIDRAGGFYYGVRDINIGAGAYPPGVAPAQILFQPPFGGNHILYQYGTMPGNTLTLQNTAQMNNSILADVTGSGKADTIVYNDGSSLRYYTIPVDSNGVCDGLWKASNDHAIPGTPANAIPLAVLQTAANAPGIVIYKSGSGGTTFKAVSLAGTNLATFSAMKQMWAVDARHQGYNGDLLWYDYSYNVGWREGVTGTNHFNPAGWSAWWAPAGGAKLLPGSGNAAKTMLFKDTNPEGLLSVVAADVDGNYVDLTIDKLGPNGTYLGPVRNDFEGNGFKAGDLDGDGFDDLLFVNFGGTPIQWITAFNGLGAGTYAYDPSSGSTNRLIGVTHMFAGPPVPTSYDNISDLQNAAIGEVVNLSGKVIVADVLTNSGTSISSVGFYLEEPDRSSGIKVYMNGNKYGPGTHVAVTGVIAMEDGHRVVNAYAANETAVQYNIINANGTNLVTNVGQFARAIGGDVDGDGNANDIVFKTADGKLKWRKGINGADQLILENASNVIPVALGHVLLGKPTYRILCYSPLEEKYSMRDTIGGVVTIGQSYKWPYFTILGDVDGLGYDKTLLYNVAIQPFNISDNGEALLNYYIDAGTWTPSFGAPCGAVTIGAQKSIVGTYVDGLRVYIPTNYNAGTYGVLFTQDYTPEHGAYLNLAGTSDMKNFIVGDCNGDGKNEVVYRDSSTDEMSYYVVPTDSAPHPTNIHLVSSTGIPVSVLNDGGARKILFRDPAPDMSLFATIKSIGEGLTMNGLSVVVTGTVMDLHVDSDPLKHYFAMSDGSPSAIRVYSRVLPVIGKMVRVNGTVGAVTVGSTPVTVIFGGLLTYLENDQTLAWDFNGSSSEGWNAYNQVIDTIGVSSGSLNYTTKNLGSNNNAPVMAAVCNIDGATYKTIKIRLATNDAGSTNFPSGLGFDVEGKGAATKPFIGANAIIADSAFHEYTLDMSTKDMAIDWTSGKIIELRLNIPNGGTIAADVKVDYIHILP